MLILYFLPIVSNTLLEKLEDKMLYFLAPRILFGKRRLEHVHLEYMRGQAGAPSDLFISDFKLCHWEK